MAKVVGLFLYDEKGAQPFAVDSARPGPRGGLEGDHHGARPDRGILMVDKDVLDEHGLKPGALREQVTLEGLSQLNTLRHGSKIEVGQAILEVLDPCAPCLIIGQYNGVDDPETFRDAIVGRRGVFVRFTDEGAGSEINIGDLVALI